VVCEARKYFSYPTGLIANDYYSVFYYM
jgi:hypothetical protein